MELPSTQPGYFQIFLGPVKSGWYFQANCPCGCGNQIFVGLDQDGDTKKTSSHRWGWNGDLERPTLTPSLRRTHSCKMHFNLNAGVYTIHSDGAPAAPNLYRAP